MIISNTDHWMMRYSHERVTLPLSAAWPLLNENLYKSSMSANMDHNLFPICSAPSTMPILLVMDRSGAVRYFGTRVKAFRIFFILGTVPEAGYD